MVDFAGSFPIGKTTKNTNEGWRLIMGGKNKPNASQRSPGNTGLSSNNAQLNFSLIMDGINSLNEKYDSLDKKVTGLDNKHQALSVNVKHVRSVIVVLVTAVFAVIGYLFYINSGVSYLRGRIADAGDLDELTNVYYRAENGSYSYERYVAYTHSESSEHHNIEIHTIGHPPKRVLLSDANLISALSNVSEHLEDIRNFCNEASIGKSVNGEDIYIRDLVNTYFLMTFSSPSGEEIRMLGGLNGQREWHGLIAHSRYDGNKLVGLFEAEYRNGERENVYAHIYPYIENISIDGSTREMNGFRVQHHVTSDDGFEYSEIFFYLRIEIPEDKLEPDSPIRFEDIGPYGLVSYFRGTTSDGRFNDTTGNAISISFDENGYIRNFYNGHFIDGRFNDDRVRDDINLRNSAFRIGWRHDSRGYTFYSGPFMDGGPAFPYLPYDGTGGGEGHIRIINVNESPFSDLLESLDVRPELLRWRT
ncbi:MAG: hypothetical protein FWB91_02815 [Defluviitaleaceae bacterium]|nr:hypothetical protein [Defluviitaleaceae bacterium]